MDVLKNKDVYIELTPEERRRFNTVIDEMVKKTNKTFEKVTRNMARDVARSALSKTPLAPKNHSTKDKKTGKYWIKMKHAVTGEDVRFLGTAEQAIKYGQGTSIPTHKRGFLKSGWASALYKLGVGRGSKYMENSKWGEAQVKGSSDNFMIRLINEVPFVSEWDEGRNRWHTPQHVIERSINECTSFWDRVLKRYANEVTLPSGAFRTQSQADEYAKNAEMPINGDRQ